MALGRYARAKIDVRTGAGTGSSAGGAGSGKAPRWPKLRGPPNTPPTRKFDGGVSENSTLYTLRSIPSGNWMGFRNNENDATSYIIAFKHKEHAQLVWSFAHEATKMQIKNLVMENITSHIEKMCNVPTGSFGIAGLPPVFADLDAHLCIDKKPNINKLGTNIAPITAMEYMAIPFELNLGVVLTKRLIENTKNSIMFESEVIDPIRDLDLFRKTLMERRKRLLP